METGEDGLCCSSSAIQTRLGPSSLLEERSEIPIVLLFLLCCRLPPKLGEMAKVYIYIECTRAVMRAWKAMPCTNSYGKQAAVTLAINEDNIKCTENLKQCHVCAQYPFYWGLVVLPPQIFLCYPLLKNA